MLVASIRWLIYMVFSDRRYTYMKPDYTRTPYINERSQWYGIWVCGWRTFFFSYFPLDCGHNKYGSTTAIRSNLDPHVVIVLATWTSPGVMQQCCKGWFVDPFPAYIYYLAQRTLSSQTSDNTLQHIVSVANWYREGDNKCHPAQDLWPTGWSLFLSRYVHFAEGPRWRSWRLHNQAHADSVSTSAHSTR